VREDLKATRPLGGERGKKKGKGPRTTGPEKARKKEQNPRDKLGAIILSTTAEEEPLPQVSMSMSFPKNRAPLSRRPERKSLEKTSRRERERDRDRDKPRIPRNDSVKKKNRRGKRRARKSP